MSNKIYKYVNLRELTIRIRDDLKTSNFVIMFAYNRTGKTRLSMAFKDYAKKKGAIDTLYFNAFTEDLFLWDNDLETDTNRCLVINSKSKFFSSFRELALEEKIFYFLSRYADFDFKIDYENWKISFSRGEEENIKISRGEQNIFIWCIFLSISQLVIDGHESYDWVKNLYIDDPVSSLDDNNTIAIAADLASLLQTEGDNVKKVKAVISTHHILFFNVMCNALKKDKIAYFYNRPNKSDTYTLQKNTGDTPFLHHVAMLSELKIAIDKNQLYTYHFNIMRSILEKTSSFFGFNNLSDCIKGIEDEVLFSRAVNLLSHGKHSVYEPKEMGEDNKELFKKIFDGFQAKYGFNIPEINN